MSPQLATLSALPSELIFDIADFLERNDVLSIRLACKELLEKTLPFCGYKYFSVITTNVSRQSLERLKLSFAPSQLSTYVQTLLVQVNPDGYQPHPIVGTGYTWQRHDTGQLVFPNPASDILQDILVHHFTNCRSWRLSNIWSYPYSGASTDISEYSSDYITTADVVSIFFNILSTNLISIKGFYAPCFPPHPSHNAMAILFDESRVPISMGKFRV